MVNQTETPERKSIQISADDYEKLKARYDFEKEHGITFMSFGPWSSRKIGQMADKEAWIHQRYPYLVLSKVDRYGAMIRDTKTGILNEVKLVKNKVTCMTCEGHPDNCDHAMLVQASKRSHVMKNN